eukprot:GHVH01002391.1.p1 GENE.GHVH01002391.1~~GHVH01002391.1.p1  ORF type:complete len:738 (+),score=88.59 GHVH01002391.1:201-2414(+)
MALSRQRGNRLRLGEENKMMLTKSSMQEQSSRLEQPNEDQMNNNNNNNVTHRSSTVIGSNGKEINFTSTGKSTKQQSYLNSDSFFGTTVSDVDHNDLLTDSSTESRIDLLTKHLDGFNDILLTHPFSRRAHYLASAKKRKRSNHPIATHRINKNSSWLNNPRQLMGGSELFNEVRQKFEDAGDQSSAIQPHFWNILQLLKAENLNLRVSGSYIISDSKVGGIQHIFFNSGLYLSGHLTNLNNHTTVSSHHRSPRLRLSFLSLKTGTVKFNDRTTCPPKGVGRILYINGDAITANIEMGEPVGRGQIVKANGDVYTGEILARVPDGDGMMHYKDSRLLYSGGWKAGRREGAGVLVRMKQCDSRTANDFILPSNSSSLPLNLGGVQSTDSALRFMDGGDTDKLLASCDLLYRGGFRHGFYHGEGLCHLNEGHVYRGQWVNGARQGVGKQWFNVKQEKGGTASFSGFYDGQWSRLLELDFSPPKQEPPLACTPENLSYFSRGVKPLGRRHGIGTMNYPDGRVYFGMWRNGKRTGLGKMTYLDGTSLEGMWENNHFSHVIQRPCGEDKNVVHHWPSILPNAYFAAEGLSHSKSSSLTQSSLLMAPLHKNWTYTAARGLLLRDNRLSPGAGSQSQSMLSATEYSLYSLTSNTTEEGKYDVTVDRLFSSEEGKQDEEVFKRFVLLPSQAQSFESSAEFNRESTTGGCNSLHSLSGSSSSGGSEPVLSLSQFQIKNAAKKKKDT